jgi:hypothetical protein
MLRQSATHTATSITGKARKSGLLIELGAYPSLSALSDGVAAKAIDAQPLSG